jgi:hypothetical protein
VPRFCDHERGEGNAGAPRTVVRAHQRHQALAGDDAHARAKQMEDDQRDGRKRQHPEQLVSVLRAEDRVGRDAGRVIVRKAGQHTGADDRQKHRGGPPTEQQVPPAHKTCMKVAAGTPAWMPASRRPWFTRAHTRSVAAAADSQAPTGLCRPENGLSAHPFSPRQAVATVDVWRIATNAAGEYSRLHGDDSHDALSTSETSTDRGITAGRS